MTALLQDWVTGHADRRPDAVAVVSGTDRLSYGELETLTNRVAALLKDAGCKRGDRVCLLMPKSAMAVVGLLAIYKADCIFVPLDAASPAARLAKILDACDSHWILGAGPVAGLLDELFEDPALRATTSVAWLTADRPSADNFAARFDLTDAHGYPAAPLEYRNTPLDPAHILFTSGSTGVPKGVVITHANVIHFVEWARRYFGLAASDRISGHSPFHFDLSTFDLFGTFSAGARLHLVPPELNVLPHRLAEFIRAAELTQWFSVPSILNYLANFDVVQPGDFPAMERLLWCGEVFPTPALIYWMERLPHVRFTNLYGPTEATIASSYYSVPACPTDPGTEVPIGAGCDGEDLLVLDEHRRPVPVGEMGDLYIRGVGLSPGYWRDPERTAAVFVPNPADPGDRLYKTGDLARVGADGLVYFLGRADSQIKSRGHRIELGEVEAALNTLGGLQEAAVVGIPTGGFEGTLIGCAYAPVSGRELRPAAVRAALGELLPSYMLPARWLVLPSLPKNANGKIDRRALRDRFQANEAAAR